MRSALMAAKIILAIVLLAIMVRANVIDFRPILRLWGHVSILLGAGTCLFAGLVVGAARWAILLRAAGVPLKAMVVFRIQLIGSLFSTFLPGAAGGDAARAAYLCLVLHAHRTKGLMALAVDRLFSLFGLVALTGILLLANTGDISLHPVLGLYARWSAGLLAAAVMVTGILYVMARRFHIPTFTIGWIERLRPHGRQVREVVLLYGQHWPSLVACTILSVAASAIVVIGIVILAQAFDFVPALRITALAATLGNISSAIPLTPGGIGIGEAMFDKVCADMAGRPGPYASIYLAFRVVMALVSLSGLYAYVSFGPVRHRASVLPQP